MQLAENLPVESAYVGRAPSLAKSRSDVRNRSKGASMRRLILAATAVLLFTTAPWAQMPLPPGASVVRVDSRVTKHRAHAHRRHTAHRRSRRRHSA